MEAPPSQVVESCGDWGGGGWVGFGGGGAEGKGNWEGPPGTPCREKREEPRTLKKQQLKKERTC